MSGSLWLPWAATHQASLSFTISQSLLRFMSTELVMPSNHLILCRPLPLLPSIFPNTRVFSNELALIEVIELKWGHKVGSSQIRPVSLWKRETGSQAHVHTSQGRQCEEIQEEDKYIWVKERGLNQTPPSQPSEGINPANTSNLDFQSSEHWDDTHLLFKPPSLWYCVMV